MSASPSYRPLADRMRPRTLDEVFGQTHLLAPGAPLRILLDHGQCPSLVFWGPPGVGKTTLARLVARYVDAEFVALSAVLAGVKDLREVVERVGAKPKQVFQPVRVAISGTTISPGIFESLELLGREDSLARIDAALAKRLKIPRKQANMGSGP